MSTKNNGPKLKDLKAKELSDMTPAGLARGIKQWLDAGGLHDNAAADQVAADTHTRLILKKGRRDD